MKIVLDLIMLIALAMLIGFQYFPRAEHEIIGVLWLIMATIHLYYNRRYLKGLLHGKWSTYRLIVLLLNASVLISIVAAIFTGVCISNYLFKGYLPSAVARSTLIHQIHIGASYYALVFIGLHLGFHWSVWWKKLQARLNLKISTYIASVLAIIIALAGGYAAYLNELAGRLMLKHIFMTPAASGTASEYFSYLAMLLGLFVLLGYGISRFLIRGKAK